MPSALALLALALAAGKSQSQSISTELTLDGKMVRRTPGHDTTEPASELVAGKRVERFSDISRATVTWYPARTSPDALSPAMIVLPGGGYRILATDLEGSEVCAWLNAQGISALLLRYQVPTSPPHAGPLSDAEAALALLQARASLWHIDTSHIGVVGFSAGAHLAGRLAAVSAPGTLHALLLLYPAYYAGGGEDTAAVRFPSSTPAAFIVQAQDDPIGIMNATSIFAELNSMKVPAELHIYPTGGHGYGLRPTSSPITHWPTLAASWLQTVGFIAAPLRRGEAK